MTPTDYAGAAERAVLSARDSAVRAKRCAFDLARVVKLAGCADAGRVREYAALADAWAEEALVLAAEVVEHGDLP